MNNDIADFKQRIKDLSDKLEEERGQNQLLRRQLRLIQKDDQMASRMLELFADRRRTDDDLVNLQEKYNQLERKYELLKKGVIR